MRAFLTTLIASVSVLTGADAFGYSTIEVCNGADKSVEDFKKLHETYLIRDALGQKRQKSLMAWIKTTTAENVSTIWGEPELYEGREVWKVQWEPSFRVHTKIHYRDENPCFYYDETHFLSFVIVEFETNKGSRNVHTVIQPHP